MGGESNSDHSLFWIVITKLIESYSILVKELSLLEDYIFLLKFTVLLSLFLSKFSFESEDALSGRFHVFLLSVIDFIIEFFLFLMPDIVFEIETKSLFQILLGVLVGEKNVTFIADAHNL